MTTRLLFVCLGNICRSPSAENIMNHLLKQQGLEQQISCDSAGTSSYHIGSSPDSRMTAAAKKQGIKMVGRARQFIVDDFEQFDLILAMDDSNYHSILSLDPAGKYTHKVKRMCDFCKDHSDLEVPDPYYGGADGFDYVIDLLMDACDGLLQEISD
ncbi:MAG: low molecular weight protein-tyrosine-phosphatase [Cyanobacteria bacterium J06642_11]